MASEPSGRHARPVEPGEDPVGDAAEAEPEEEPADLLGQVQIATAPQVAQAPAEQPPDAWPVEPGGDTVGDAAEAEPEEEPADLARTPARQAPAILAALAVARGRGAAAIALLAVALGRLAVSLGRLAALGVARLRDALIARWPAVRAALRPRLLRLVITIVGGLALCASFPPLGWWWAAVAAAALLASVLKNPATTPVGGFGYGFLFGLAFYLPLLPWISGLVGAVPWLALATVCALFPALFGLSAVVVRALPGWPIWFALLWAAQEWLKSIVPFGGFPWGSVAFGQTEGPFLPLVQLGGVALLSLGTVLVGFSATAIALEIRKWWRHDGKSMPLPAVLLPGISICLVLIGAVLVWPQVRHAGAGSGGEPTATVAVVQGNVPRLGLDFNAQRRAVLDNHVRETLRLADDVRAGVAPQPQFVIWPEDASDVDPLTNDDAGLQIAQAAQAIGAPILLGTILDVPGRRQGPVEYTNTVLVWNPVSGPADRHDKEIVQPFGEFLPMPWLFSHLSAYADRAGHMVPGKGSGVVQIAGVPVGVATCWEVIFDREPRKAVRNGAQLLAVPANNATFNKTMSEQQLAFAKVRAVEHDRYVVVAGTTGISSVIAPDGGELVRTDFFQPAYLDTTVHLKTQLTPATRWGQILQWFFAGAAGAIMLVGILHNLTRNNLTRNRGRNTGNRGAT